jgi:hypothetical protein
MRLPARFERGILCAAEAVAVFPVMALSLVTDGATVTSGVDTDRSRQ